MASGNNSRVALLFFIGALIVAGGAIFGIFSILDGYRRKAISVADKPVETITVVAASRTLYQGVGITNDDLFVVNVPPEYLPIMKDPANPKQHIKAEVYSSRERVVGQVPRERILANEFIRPERLADGSVGLGLNALIPRGMRAISVGLKGADAVQGFLTPGNYVDVLVTMKDELGERRTETILQAVFVLGVNSRAQNENPDNVRVRGSQSPSVTFLVTPNQAEDIAYADELGALGLTLRNVQDVVYTQLDGVTLNDLRLQLIKQPNATIASFDEPEVRTYRAPRSAPPANNPYGTIKVYRGTSSSEVRYQEGQ